MNELTLTLHHPLTDKEWDDITDVDFEHTNEITFYTKNGKEVVFVKKPHRIPVSEALQQPEPTNNLTKPNNEFEGWIPCSERLPEMHTDVLTCDIYGGIWICSLIFTGRNNEACWEDDYGYLHNFDELIAWMPLPSPYQSESEE